MWINVLNVLKGIIFWQIQGDAKEILIAFDLVNQDANNADLGLT